MDPEAKQYLLSLRMIFQYLNATADSRCIVEGETVLNANHLILCGITDKNENSMSLLSLCLQTSNLKEKPHQIKGKIGVVGQGNIETFDCSCKAGQSEKCKHIAAVLIYCTRLYSSIFLKAN